MLNKIIVTGRLTADIELKHTPGNIPVATFTIASDRDYAKDGNRETDFIDIVAWRKTAEFIAKNFYRGNGITIDGRLQTRNWEDKDGNKRKTIEVLAENVYFYGTKAPSYERDDEPAPAKKEIKFEEVEIDLNDGELPF